MQTSYNKLYYIVSRLDMKSYFKVRQGMKSDFMKQTSYVVRFTREFTGVAWLYVVD